MRVLPVFTVNANIERSMPASKSFTVPRFCLNCGLNTCWNAVGAAPASRRHTPASKPAAYTTLGFSGSSPRSVIPYEMKVPAHAAVGSDLGMVQSGFVPSQTIVKVAPPSFDSYTPGSLAPGSQREVPPAPITCERPRTPRAVPTSRWLELRGSITIELIPRPRKASVPGVTHGYTALLTHVSASFCQCWPPSFER